MTYTHTHRRKEEEDKKAEVARRRRKEASRAKKEEGRAIDIDWSVAIGGFINQFD